MKKITASNFSRLIGIWKTTGEVKSDQGNQPLTGTDSYEWMLDGHYILHKAAVMMGDEKSETLEIIQLDNFPDKAKMQYFNNKGEEGVMISSLIVNEFRIEGEGLKFEGTISEDNTKIKGKWSMQAKDGTWNAFIDLKLEKEKN